MAQAINFTERQNILNPCMIIVTPWVAGVRPTATQSKSYILDQVIADSTSISQDDPETSQINNEFGGAPINETVKPGSVKFAANLADIQADLLQDLAGWQKNGSYAASSNAIKRVYQKASVPDIYASIALVLTGSEQVSGSGNFVGGAIILPKVKLNSKLTIESMQSNLGVIALGGTALEYDVDNIKCVALKDEKYSYIEKIISGKTISTTKYDAITGIEQN